MNQSEKRDLVQIILTIADMFTRLQGLIQTTNARTEPIDPLNDPIGFQLGSNPSSRFINITKQEVLDMYAVAEDLKNGWQIPDAQPYVSHDLSTWGRSPYTGCGAIENTPLAHLIPMLLRRVVDERWEGAGECLAKRFPPIRRDRPECATCSFVDCDPPRCDGQYEIDNPCPIHEKKGGLTTIRDSV